MRRLLLLLSLPVLATCYAHDPAHAQGNGYPPGYYPPGPPPPPPPYAGRPGPYPSGPAYSPENCGTPDDLTPHSSTGADTL